MSGKRFAFRTAVPAMFGVCLMAAAAWACTGAPTRYDIAPATVDIGAKQSVRVTGENFGATPVEIRWNTVEGEVVGMAPGGNFAVDVQVPAHARPGVHYLVALQKDGAGTVSMKVSEVIEITGSRGASSAKSRAASGPSERSVSQDLWSSYAGSEANDLGAGLSTQSVEQSGPPVLGLLLAGAGTVSLLALVIIATASRRTRKTLG